METEKITKDIFRHYWYSKKEVLYEIVKLSQFREVIFLDKTRERLPVRCMFIYKVGTNVNTEQNKGSLLEHFEVYRFMNSNHNLYFSVAYFKNTPPFSYNPKLRREQLDKWSKEGNYKQHFAGYDLFFDFDSKDPSDLKPAMQDAAKLKALLDHYQVPYILTFSGTKGVHIRILYKFLPQNLELNIVQFCKLFAENLHRKLDLPCLDTGVFDDRRIFKAPYSYDADNICLPLTDEQFENFDINAMSAKQVLNKINLFNRGDLMRHTNFSYETQRHHFLELFKEVKQ
jgi:hypothetical protein